MIDPTISVINYHIKGPFYRLLTKWFFDPLTEDEIIDLCLPVPSSLLSSVDKADMVKQLQGMEPPYGDYLKKMQELLTDRSALAVYSPAVMNEIEVPR